MGEFVHKPQFDNRVCQEAHGPTGASLGRIGASEQGKLGFDVAGHFHRGAGSHRFFVDYSCNVGIQKAPPGIGDGQGRAADKLGDLFVGVAFFLRAVEQECDAHSGQSVGLMLAGTQDGFELLTLLGRQGKGSMFVHTLILPNSDAAYKTSGN